MVLDDLTKTKEDSKNVPLSSNPTYGICALIRPSDLQKMELSYLEQADVLAQALIGCNQSFTLPLFARLWHDVMEDTFLKAFIMKATFTTFGNPALCAHRLPWPSISKSASQVRFAHISMFVLGCRPMLDKGAGFSWSMVLLKRPVKIKEIETSDK